MTCRSHPFWAKTLSMAAPKYGAWLYPAITTLAAGVAVIRRSRDAGSVGGSDYPEFSWGRREVGAYERRDRRARRSARPPAKDSATGPCHNRAVRETEPVLGPRGSDRAPQLSGVRLARRRDH